MWEWVKKNTSLLITVLVTIGFLIFVYACEPKTSSLDGSLKKVTREELRLQLDNILATAQLRMIDLDRQDRIRSIILQNALILVQGQPFNPMGIITGFAAIYGISQGGYTIGKKVKTVANKRKINNG